MKLHEYRRYLTMKKLLLTIFVVAASATAFADVKEGSAAGFKDDIKVQVEMNAGKITAIQSEHKDTKRIAGPAIEKLTKEIIEKQTTNVDDVAGATYSSKGFKQAVANATGK